MIIGSEGVPTSGRRGEPMSASKPMGVADRMMGKMLNAVAGMRLPPGPRGDESGRPPSLEDLCKRTTEAIGAETRSLEVALPPSARVFADDPVVKGQQSGKLRISHSPPLLWTLSLGIMGLTAATLIWMNRLDVSALQGRDGGLVVDRFGQRVFVCAALGRIDSPSECWQIYPPTNPASPAGR